MAEIKIEEEQEDFIWVRGRVSSIRIKGNACFLILRSNTSLTLQICHFTNSQTIFKSKEMIQFISRIPLESIVAVYGQVFSGHIYSCTLQNIELHFQQLFVISRCILTLPFRLDDAKRSDNDIRNTKDSKRPLVGVEQDIRLNSRWIDLRVPSNNSIMRVKSGILRFFREALYQKGFIEINTPKLISGQSEGGSDVFKTDYFGQPACLAQSPQLYKQMAISSDLGKVFEIGPVFRAENSKTRRHLCEFTGLDIEMEIKSHYNEVLEELHYVFHYMFTALEKDYLRELTIIRKQYPSEPALITEKPVILHWHDAISLLSEAGHKMKEFEDLSSRQELILGQLVKEKYHTDFFILDKYPLCIRPFYTMPCPHNPLFSNSYDIFIRGQEICSGAQRCHDPDLLEKRIIEHGIDPSSLKFYIDSFRHGISPHGGAGIGLERVVFLYLGLDNVRKASMFPRDPTRCVP